MCIQIRGKLANGSREKALKKKLSNKRMVKISIKLTRENRRQILCIVDKINVNWPPQRVDISGVKPSSLSLIKG